MTTQNIIDCWQNGVEPYTPDWEADLCSVEPDNCWIDRATGEHINATTNERTLEHISDA